MPTLPALHFVCYQQPRVQTPGNCHVQDGILPKDTARPPSPAVRYYSKRLLAGRLASAGESPVRRGEAANPSASSHPSHPIFFNQLRGGIMISRSFAPLHCSVVITLRGVDQGIIQAPVVL